MRYKGTRREVLELHAQGIGPSSIAVRLNLSRKEVLTYLANKGKTEEIAAEAGARTAHGKDQRDHDFQHRGFWRPGGTPKTQQ